MHTIQGYFMDTKVSQSLVKAKDRLVNPPRVQPRQSFPGDAVLGHLIYPRICLGRKAKEMEQMRNGGAGTPLNGREGRSYYRNGAHPYFMAST